MMAASENSELGFDTPQTERIEVKTIVKFYLFFLSALDARSKRAWLFFDCFLATETSFTPTHEEAAKPSVNRNRSVRVPESLSQFPFWGLKGQPITSEKSF